MVCYIVNLEHISRLFLLFLLMTMNKSMLAEMVEYFACKNAIVTIRIKIIKVIIKN